MNTSERRELDAKVAERVMGWELFKCNYFSSQEESPRQTELEPWINKVGITDVGDYFIDVDSDFWISVDDWQPSSDISAAWLVVEKLLKPNWAWNIDSFNVKDGDGIRVIWSADFWGDEIDFHATADTAPEAICLAALAAMEETK